MTPNVGSPAHNEQVRADILKAGEYHLDGGATPYSNNSLNSSPRFSDVVANAVQFKRGEEETIRRVLEEIEVVALRRMSEGFNEFNFSLGVLNCFFICYIFGAHPEHLWLLYLMQAIYAIPRKFYNMWYAKPLNQALYYLDFCWCMNFSAILLLVVLVFFGNKDVISGVARESFFNAYLGVSCGALLGANIILPFVACLFHDVNTMTGLFIHIMPPMVMYTFMWHSHDIKEAWPNIFSLDYLEKVHYFPSSGLFFIPGSGLDSVAGNSIALYFLWFLPYTCFMLLGGINLPKKYNPDGTPANPKYDTVFHSTMRGGTCIAIGKVFRGRPKHESLKQMEQNDFDVIDFFIYMAFHMIAAFLAFYLIGYPCFCSRKFHLWMLVASITLAVTRGAKRYTYYSTIMYSKMLQKQFAYLLDDKKES